MQCSRAHKIGRPFRDGRCELRAREDLLAHGSEPSRQRHRKANLDNLLSEQVTGRENKRRSGSNDTFPELHDIAPVSGVSAQFLFVAAHESLTKDKEMQDS